MIRIIEVSYEESIIKRIVDFIMAFFRKVNTFYENSVAARIASIIATVLCNSSIIRFFARRGRLAEWWHASLIFKLIDSIIRIPSKLFGCLFRRFEAVLMESLILRLVKLILGRMEILIGGALVLTLLVPHERWNNGYIIFIALALAFSVFINTVINRGWEFNFRALDFSFIIFAVTVLLSYFTSIMPSASLKFLLFHLSCFLLVLVIVSTIKNEKSLSVLIEIILVGTTIIALYGLWQVATDSIRFDPSLTDLDSNEGMPGRVYSTFFNPNNFAELLIMMLPFYVAIVLNSKSIVKKSVYFALMLPTLAVLFYTGSRSGWIGFMVSVIVMTFFVNKRLLPLVAAAGFIAVPFLPVHVIKRIQTIGQAFEDSSVQYRLKIWQTVIPMLKDYYITGTGLGTNVFMDVTSKYHQYTVKTPPHTHILYLQIWVEVGLSGIISFLWFIARTFKLSVLSIYQNSSKALKNILAAGLAALSGILVTGLVEYVWYYERVLMMFWVVAGIVIAASNIKSEKAA